ncbi:MAG TPA: PP2C family serine/threonine-protein phosphatase [Allosphingosinicella sp.]
MRDINADAYVKDDAAGFYAIADGVGSLPASAAASRFATKEALRLFLARRWHDAGAACDLQRLIGDVAAGFRTHFSAEGTPSTTLTLAVLRGLHLSYASVGDAPVILLSGGTATLLTRDHTIADRGRLFCSYDAVKTLGGSNVLFTSIGPFPPQVTCYPSLECPPGSRLLLCSDGLFQFLTQDDLAKLSANCASSTEFVGAIRRLSATSRARDNVSLILINLPGTETGHAAMP